MTITTTRTRHVTMTGAELQQWRATNDVTQHQLAEWLQIAPNSISRWERGGALIPPYLVLALNWLALVKHTAQAGHALAQVEVSA